MLHTLQGIRNTQGHLEVCIQYPGWPQPLWLDISHSVGNWKNMKQFMRLQQQGEEEALTSPDMLHRGFFFCLPLPPSPSLTHRLLSPSSLILSLSLSNDYTPKHAGDSDLHCC